MTMKLGFGLYRHQLNEAHYRFARQCGATHLVIHMVDYFNASRSNRRGDQPVGGLDGWGDAGDPEALWTAGELRRICREASAHGLEVFAIENFDPAHWGDVLLDGPLRDKHIDNVKALIRATGEAGIGVIGYNFSIAGVAGRVTGPFARGAATAVGMEGVVEDPVPNGMVWNMWVNRDAPEGTLRRFDHEELWRRLDRFLDEVLPVAEEADVTLALHPDDPPVPFLRNTPRLVYQKHLYQRMIDRHSSPRAGIELCCGTLAEMDDSMDVYEAIASYVAQNRVAYVHLRNAAGKVPRYRETFIDEGDLDILRVIRILHRNGFDGLVIPDHAPGMTCDAPWHAGMAFAMGYLRAAIRDSEEPVADAEPGATVTR